MQKYIILTVIFALHWQLGAYAATPKQIATTGKPEYERVL